MTDALRITRGHPLPFGATPMRGGINFAVFSKHASSISLVLFSPNCEQPIAELRLDPKYNRTGDVWHAFVWGLDSGIEYGYRADGINDEQLHRYDPRVVLIDPYARALSVIEHHERFRPTSSKLIAPLVRRRSRVADAEFRWGREHPLNTHLSDTIIYEIHVKGFTRHESSGVDHAGTFTGIVEKIPYFKDLGITAVELMPVTDFDHLDNPRVNPLTGEQLTNYWGYHPISFFALKEAYAATDDAIREFKSMTSALHESGIEVILDIVFNHTGEGELPGEEFSFRGLDNATYYLMERETGEWSNYSGCGNTLNCNHPVVRDLILDSLRYWVTEMHVDGFRFDLASILGRGRDGSVLPNPPLLERISADPVLSHTKLIAEAWDAAGLYQVGSFPNWGRWAEWNGQFRDDVRRFVRGDAGMVPRLATRLAGSSDLYHDGERAPYHSINFVTSHDGFTLQDLVSYNRKHNEANGELNEDGTTENFSWNCGEEGPALTPDVEQLRKRQVRNFLTILFLSQGVPMLLGGDEMGRSQNGNNNAYCQDNETSWINWGLRDRNSDLYRFVRRLILLRKSSSLLKRTTFLDGSHVTWHGVQPYEPDWSEQSRALGMLLTGDGQSDDLLLMANAGPDPIRFTLPPAFGSRSWFRLIDTALTAPEDAAEEGAEPLLGDQRTYDLAGRSVVVLLGRNV